MDAENVTDPAPIIDFGGHLYTAKVPNRPSSIAEFESIIPGFGDPEAMIELYESAGIMHSVIVAPHYVHATLDQVTTANDILRDIIESHDHFYGGLASIPMTTDGEAAATEFRRCLSNGFDGGVLETRTDDGRPLTDPVFEPVFEVAAEVRAPILVHPKQLNLFSTTTRNDSVFGHEVTLAESLANLIHSGILDRYPDLTMIYDHYGGNIASFLGRLEYQLKPDRWPGDFDGKPWPEFRHQLDERIHLKMSGFFASRSVLRHTLEAFSSTRLLFGTDVPFEPRSTQELTRYVQHVRDHASPTDCRRIFAENTRSLLNSISHS